MAAGGPDGRPPLPDAAPVRISGTTRLVALFGSPVAHSRSPGLHNRMFEALGLDLVYLAFEVGLDQPERAVDTLRLLGARGANVTLPLKRAVLPYLDRLNESACLAGAVNTIVNDGGVLTGYMTDGVGYLRGLDDAGIAYAGRTFTVVGVGGAAGAVAIEAARAGARALHLFNRRDAFHAQAEAMATLIRTRLGCPTRLHDLDDHEALAAALAESDILVNGTPIGMDHGPPGSVLPTPIALRPELVVTDLIYAPAETPLLRRAREAGCRTVNGLGMQLHQAAEAFRLWTGRAMPLDRARGALSG